MSSENVRAETPQKPDSRLRAAAALLALCAVLVLFLALVQALIGDRVRAGEEERWNEQLRAVMPGAESFSEIWFDHARADSMLAAFDGGEMLGYCVQVTTRGFGGDMELLVGVNLDGSVTGVRILTDQETQEMGAQAREPAFLDQFLGKSGTIRVERGSNTVEAISGATVTSQAVTDGVNAALAAVANLETGGGDIGEEGTV